MLDYIPKMLKAHRSRKYIKNTEKIEPLKKAQHNKTENVANSV